MNINIRCVCGHEWWARADRWRVFCPACQLGGNMQTLRDKLELEGTQK